MSLEDLSDFIFAIEHSLSLRKEIKECQNNLMLICIAKKYGYQITNNDLTKNSIEERINQWFKESKIDPIKR